jgi:hypothetical protein
MRVALAANLEIEPMLIHPTKWGDRNNKNKQFMNWISIEEKMPQEGEQVLVIGFLSTELFGRRKEKSVGLVNWESAEKSDCSDYCYYELEYQDITHWQPITLP